MKSKYCVICDVCNEVVVEGTCSCKNVAFKDNTVYCDNNNFTIILGWFNNDNVLTEYVKAEQLVYKESEKND